VNVRRNVAGSDVLKGDYPGWQIPNKAIIFENSSSWAKILFHREITTIKLRALSTLEQLQCGAVARLWGLVDLIFVVKPFLYRVYCKNGER
jgi:hypothetical protein